MAQADLKLFLADNMEKVEDVPYVATKRLKDKDGKPVAWTLRPVDADTDTRIRRASTKVTKDRRTNTKSRDLDGDDYALSLAAACVVWPELTNVELQKSYGAMGEKALLKKMLLPGELADLEVKAQEICGFDALTETDIDEAKN